MEIARRSKPARRTLTVAFVALLLPALATAAIAAEGGADSQKPAPAARPPAAMLAHVPAPGAVMTTVQASPAAAPLEAPPPPATAPPDAAAPGGPADLWSDPTFQKQFLGSYGTQAEIEPKVSPIERDAMEKILPLMSSDPAGAAGQLEAILTPESSAVLDFTLGNIRFQQGNLESATKHYETAIAKFPSFRRAHKNLGLIRVRTGQFGEAVVSLSRVVELGGGDGLTFGLLGYGYAATQRYVSAESAYREAILLQPEVLDWKLGLAQSLLKQRKFAETASLCEELIAAHPDRTDLWLLQASAYIGMNEPLQAAENYEILQRMGKATVQSLDTLGDIYVNASLWDLAARAYGLALEADPGQDLQRPLRNVEVLSQRGAVSQARTLLAKIRSAHASGLDPTDARRVLKLEARMAVADGSGGDAVAALEEVIALDPLDGEALLLLGQHHQRTGDPDKALFYYERAASLEPFEAEAKVRQAQILVGKGRYADAIPLLTRAQELKPREEVARYLEQVERIARTR